MATLDGRFVPFEQWPLSRLLRGEGFRNEAFLVSHAGHHSDEHISYSGTLIRDADGKVSLALLTLHAVTEARRSNPAVARRPSTPGAALPVAWPVAWPAGCTTWT